VSGPGAATVAPSQTSIFSELFEAIVGTVLFASSGGSVAQVVGCTLPQFGDSAHADLVGFAEATEQLGVDSLWVADRLLAAVDPTAVHAGMRGAIPENYRTIADPLIALTVAAAATTRVRLGASVLVGPWYPPLQFARQLTTIDAVSDGRLLPGLVSAGRLMSTACLELDSPTAVRISMSCRM
jgi:Luciferase-like monooxygenase